MDETFADIFGLGIVLVCGKSSQTFLKHVDPKRIIAGDYHIDPQIIFEVVYQMRVTDVLGNEIVFFVADLGVFSDHLDTTSASLVCGFHDPEFTFVGCFACHLETVEV